MRKVRKPSSAFRDVNHDDDKQEMFRTLREARLKGEKVNKTSAKVHGCNRCIDCNGRCPI
ncbi:MAG: hypothetical protein UHG91_07220 [Succinivibrionaceae bacterium]|nr:hypothetical protein [Ruminobacter sp.]MDY5778345.1 hypothetical protein [Succinivibrionaceae bacterium]MEE1340551.1 hypothetical protein [Succinivibrionaceae bacterium]